MELCDCCQTNPAIQVYAGIRVCETCAQECPANTPSEYISKVAEIINSEGFKSLHRLMYPNIMVMRR